MEPEKNHARIANLNEEMDAIHYANELYWKRDGLVTHEGRAEYQRRQESARSNPRRTRSIAVLVTRLSRFSSSSPHWDTRTHLRLSSTTILPVAINFFNVILSARGIKELQRTQPGVTSCRVSLHHAALGS